MDSIVVEIRIEGEPKTLRPMEIYGVVNEYHEYVPTDLGTGIPCSSRSIRITMTTDHVEARILASNLKSRGLVAGSGKADQAEPRGVNQTEKILARLREGPATSEQLAAIGVRYAARIHELKASGIKIAREKDREGPGYVYRIEETSESVQ